MFMLCMVCYNTSAFKLGHLLEAVMMWWILSCRRFICFEWVHYNSYLSLCFLRWFWNKCEKWLLYLFLGLATLDGLCINLLRQLIVAAMAEEVAHPHVCKKPTLNLISCSLRVCVLLWGCKWVEFECANYIIVGGQIAIPINVTELWFKEMSMNQVWIGMQCIKPGPSIFGSSGSTFKASMTGNGPLWSLKMRSRWFSSLSIYLSIYLISRLV